MMRACKPPLRAPVPVATRRLVDIIVECTGGAPTAPPGGLVRHPLRDSYTVETDPLAAPIPFLEWVASFRAGEWGTAPNLGAFDLVTLIVVIISMIDFQRASPGMGGHIRDHGSRRRRVL